MDSRKHIGGQKIKPTPDEGLSRQPSSKRNAASVEPLAISSLARNAGNQAMQRLLMSGSIRPKLEIGHPEDEEEQEADRVAERVVSPAAPVKSCKCAQGTTCPECQDQKLRRKVASGSAAPTNFETTPHLGSLSQGGQPLASTSRAFFEPRFGRDLSHIRIHTGAQAADDARSIHARAFALGRNIVFGVGQFAPTSAEGQKLIAHELAHVLGNSDGAAARDPGTVRRSPDPPPTGPFTLDTLVIANPPGFTDQTLDRAYQRYRRSERSPSDARTWALRQTHGAPRDRLEQLLGADYARGQLSGTALPPIDVSQAVAPTGYGPERVAADVGTLSAQPQALTSRLQNLTATPIQNNQVSVGHFNILQGNVAEILARPLLEQALNEVRAEAPDAQLYLGVRARVLRSDGTASDPVLFSDGLIAAVRPGGLQIFRIAEIKSGAEGGVQAQEQIHRWIEGHSTTEIEILLPGVARGFRLSDTVREVVGLARAPRLIITPRGAAFAGSGSGHGVAAPTQRAELTQSAEEIRYLTQLIAQQIIQRQQAQQLLNQAQAHQLAPRPLERIDDLQSPGTVRTLIHENAGTALIQGQLYRVAIQGSSISIRTLAVTPISLPRLPAPGQATATATLPSVSQPAQSAAQAQAGSSSRGQLALPAPGGPPAPLEIPVTPPSGFLIPPNVLNFTAGDIVIGGRVVAPTPSGEPLRAGELIVVGFSSHWVVADIRNQQPIAGVFEGGEWYRVVSGGRVLPLDDAGRVRTEVEPIPFEHLPAVARTAPAAAQPGASGSSYGTGTRAVAGAVGIIAVANELLGSINQVLNVQRHNIAIGNAEVNFWTRFNANPTFGVWSQNDRVPLPIDSEPETAVLWGSPSYRYVADIDVEAFKASLPNAIQSYRDYLLFLDLAKSPNLGTIIEEPPMPAFPSAEERREPRRYYAFVNRDDPVGRRRYDITDTMLALRDNLIGQLDAEMRGRLRELPVGEQSNIFRLRSGSETPLFRSASGGQPILSDQQLLGDDPWVHPVGVSREGGAWRWFRYGQWRDRVLVEPANADAKRGSVVTNYLIKKSIGDVLEEVEEGHRPILYREPAEGELQSFVAGPEPGVSRFGETRYYRHQEMPNDWTVGIGELRQFWVNSRDLEPVTSSDVSTYANQPGTSR